MEIMNIIMSISFILFMVFVFGGYHKNKSAEREAGFKRDKENGEAREGALGHEEEAKKNSEV